MPKTAVSASTSSPDGGGGANEASAAVATIEPPSSTRRIIYEAKLELEVDALGDFEVRLPGWIRDHGGYLAEARTDRSPGRRPTGRWIARIPVERFEAFLAAVGDAGYARRLNQTSQEVTQEYVDLEARIVNAKRLEERLVKLLESTRGELAEVITVEKELARARGELEQLEGRRRLLDHRTSLSTVTIEVQERDPYVAPQAPESSLRDRLAGAWNGSVDLLRQVVEAALLAFVAGAPWGGVAVVACTPVWLVWRRRTHRST
jgi:hypothetical protein